jgi:hypothetical protein
MLFHSDLYKIIRNVKPVQCSCRLLPAPPVNDAHDSSNSAKSPASGIATVSSCLKCGECAKSCARRSVCFRNRKGGDASILADHFFLEWHIGSLNTSRIQPGHSRVLMICAVYPMDQSGRWLAYDTWWPLSCDWGARTVPFVRLALKVAI